MELWGSAASELKQRTHLVFNAIMMSLWRFIHDEYEAPPGALALAAEVCWHVALGTTRTAVMQAYENAEPTTQLLIVRRAPKSTFVCTGSINRPAHVLFLEQRDCRCVLPRQASRHTPHHPCWWVVRGEHSAPDGRLPLVIDIWHLSPIFCTPWAFGRYTSGKIRL